MRLKELRDLHCSPSVVRDDNRAGCACGGVWGVRAGFGGGT